MTGESYVTHLTVVEETMGAKQPELKQTDSQSTTQSKEQCSTISIMLYLHLCICEKKQRWRFLPDFFLLSGWMPVKKHFDSVITLVQIILVESVW